MGWQGDRAQFFVASSVSDPRSLTAAQVERVRLPQLKNTEIRVRCKRKREREQKFFADECRLVFAKEVLRIFAED